MNKETERNGKVKRIHPSYRISRNTLCYIFFFKCCLKCRYFVSFVHLTICYQIIHFILFMAKKEDTGRNPEVKGDSF